MRPELDAAIGRVAFYREVRERRVRGPALTFSVTGMKKLSARTMVHAYSQPWLATPGVVISYKSVGLSRVVRETW